MAGYLGHTLCPRFEPRILPIPFHRALCDCEIGSIGVEHVAIEVLHGGTMGHTGAAYLLQRSLSGLYREDVGDARVAVERQ
jgi:hypothetical protein